MVECVPSLSLFQILLITDQSIFVVGHQKRILCSLIKLFQEAKPGSPLQAVYMDSYTQGHQQNQDTSHQQAEGDGATGQALLGHRVWGPAHFLLGGGLRSGSGSGGKDINHT